MVAKILKQKGRISSFGARKIIHSFAALSVFIAPYLHNLAWTIQRGLVMSISTLLSRKKSPKKPFQELYDAIHEEKEERIGYLQGPFWFCSGVTILMAISLFFKERIYISIT